MTGPEESSLADARERRSTRTGVRTLCLGGPLHGTMVHVDRECWRCESPSDGQHSYRRVRFSAEGEDCLVYVHDLMSTDDAFASFLAWRDLT